MKIHSLENTGSISVDGVDIISLNPNGTIQIGTQTVFTAASYEEATATGGTITNQTIGNQIINGDLIVTGSLTAQQFIVSSSVTYLTTSFASGSTKFGDTLDDVHGFTGSLSISGSFIINGASYDTTTSGTSGSGGTSGSSGSSGTNGTDGTGGTSGTNGTDGTGGTSGTNGTAGTGGTSGADGSSGATGSSGSGGTSGTGGTDGTGGTSGTSGGSGSSGATGSSGSAGTSGTSGTATTSTRVEENFIATANQTTFTVTGGYTVGLVDVFVNGVRFLPTEYTATNGTTIVFDAGLMVNDEVTVLNYTSVITALPTSRNVQDFTATSGQTTFTVTNGYIVGLLDVFVNGSKLTSSEFTATNGTTFVLTIASTVGDQVQSINYTASVNGVSGAGTTNQLAYYTASSTLSSLTTSTYPSLTELSYVKGVTDAIQTQLNAKAATLSGTTNNIPKFTSSSAIGNSAITDDGTTVTLVSRALSGTTATFSGNLGVGVSSFASWSGGTENVLQVKNASIYEYGGYETALSVNAYYNSGWKYIGSNVATQFQVSSGTFTFNRSTSGTTGNAISWTPSMTINSSGNVGIGTSSPSQKLHISDSTAVYCRIISTGGGDVYLGSETNIGVLSVSNAMALDVRTNNTTRLYITSIGAVAIGATVITDPYTATGGGWQTVQFGKGGILGAYRTDNESMTGFNTYVATDGSNKAIISSIGGSAIRYYEDRITFNTLSTSGTAQTQTERMRITSAGNLGVGITPSAWGSFTALQLGGNTYNALASSNHYLNVSANTYYDGTNFRYITTNFATRYQQSDGTHLWYVGPSGTAGNTVSFSTAMVITSAGNLCIGTSTAQDARLTLSYAGGVDWAVGPKSGTSSFAIIGSTGGGGGVYVSNGGTSWAAWSDRRVKKNIENLNYGLSEILSISPVRFNYLTDDNDNANRIGFIAQDVQEYIPEMVNIAYDDILGMSSTDLVPVLVKAIQELSAKVTLLENAQ